MDSQITDQRPEQVDIVDMLNNLKASDGQPQEAVEGNQPQPTGTEPIEPVQDSEPPAVDPRESEIETLRRVIAGDPVKRHQYEMMKYGQSAVDPSKSPPPPQQPKPQPIEPPQAQPYQMPFDDENPFDPTDPSHFQALVGTQVQQAIAPLFQYVQHLQQQEQQELMQQQAHKAYEQINQSEQQIAKTLELHVPGYSEWHTSAKPSAPQKMVRQFAQAEFQERLFEFHPPTQQGADGRPFNPLWLNPHVQKEVIDAIGPQVKQMAAQLGLMNPVPQQQPIKAKGVYVEAAGAVPTSTVNPFEKAHKQGDLTGMVAALGRIN